MTSPLTDCGNGVAMNKYIYVQDREARHRCCVSGNLNAMEVAHQTGGGKCTIFERKKIELYLTPLT